MTEIKGPFEAIGGLICGVAGLYMGYKLGDEAVQYTKTIIENQGTIEYVVNQHPGITKLVTTVGVGNMMGEIGRVPGILADYLFDTRKE